jgi:glycosyltransferase involved in cell wall biosynthesis
MKDIVEDGVTGLLVPTGDHAALAERCITLLHRPSEMNQVSLRARAQALTYSWDRVAVETLSFFQGLLHQASSGRPAARAS